MMNMMTDDTTTDPGDAPDAASPSTSGPQAAETSRDRLGLAVMDTDECWGRLADEPVGRLALVVQGRPHVVPLNHVVRGRKLFVVSVPGTKLHDVLHRPGQPAAFEVDHYDEAGRSGWSVVVHGHLHPVQDLVEHTHHDVRGRPIWLDGYRDRTWLRLDPDQVEGRVLDHAEDDR